MLSQIDFWLQVVGTIVDAILLVRIFALRLRKTYLYITLACTLTLLFDVAVLRYSADREVWQRIFLYSRFLNVLVFPLLVWDVFEEIKSRVAKIRRLAMWRLVSGILFTTLLSLILIAFAEPDSSEGTMMPTLAFILWAGSSTASLAFLITMHRVLRVQTLPLPNNTAVWLRYYELELASEVLYCFWLIAVQVMKSEAIANGVGLGFSVFAIAITLWCAWRIKRIPSEDSAGAVVDAPR